MAHKSVADEPMQTSEALTKSASTALEGQQ